VKKIIVCVLAVFGLALWADAGIRIGLMGGYASMSEYGGGIAYGGTIGIDLMKYVAVEIKGTRFQGGTYAGAADGLSQGVMTRMPLEFHIQGRIPLMNGKLIPYLAVGAGFGLNSYEVDAGLIQEWSDLNMTLAETVENKLIVPVIGLGFDFALMPNFVVNLEGRYLIGKANGSWSLTENNSGLEATGTLTDLNMNTMVFGLGFKFQF
jgi:opacity protein-like surface antigen